MNLKQKFYFKILLFRTGTGGGESTYNGLCVLPLNMVNQKFYTLFWIWLSILLVANAVMITFRFSSFGWAECSNVLKSKRRN